MIGNPGASTASRRRILVCACGLSPQIVTETLYALAVRDDWLPHEIHLITTREGAERARLTLLSSEPGWFHRLREEYELPPIRLDDGTIHVLADRGGRPLDDIRSPSDNEAAADAITEIMRALTTDPDSAVHASIAGGRKTMGFYLGYVMSLFGRPQDRLSHVLISAPFESNPGFFYPSRRSRVIFTPPPDSRPLDTRDAQVTLAPIPFVRLRDGLTDAIRDDGASFSAAVIQAQRTLAPPELVLQPAEHRLVCGGVTVELPPVEFGFYAWLAGRTRQGRPDVCRNALTAADTAEFLAAYPRADELSGGFERVAEAVGEVMDKDYFDQRRSRVNTILRRTLGAAAVPYQIHGDGRRPRSRYALGLKPAQIRFSDAEMTGER